MMRMSRVSLVVLGVVAAVVFALGFSMTPTRTLHASGTMTCPVCNPN